MPPIMELAGADVFGVLKPNPGHVLVTWGHSADPIVDLEAGYIFHEFADLLKIRSPAKKK